MDIQSRLILIDNLEADSPVAFEKMMVELYRDYTAGTLTLDEDLNRELRDRISDWIEHRLPEQESIPQHVSNPPKECRREYTHSFGSKYHSIQTPLEGEEIDW